MARRIPLKTLYGDYCFREAALGKSPAQIRKALDARTRRSIRRSIEEGVAMFEPDWPWLRGLREASART